ncbi:MAG: PGF-CTERM-anchored ABC transporter substrate-binding protein [Halobacteriales archaeon]|nr:PGF-CTERM-anchored ABC transporter substrate-binding protein [Halobacteriales archaeon]
MVGAPAVGTPVQPARAQQADCSFPYTATDLSGTEITIEEEPQRIVTLNPSAAQTMWELNAEEKVVGVSIYADYLEGAGNRTIVYNRDGAQLEKIVDLQPDLVLAPNTIGNDTVDTLRRAGLTVYHFDEAVSLEFIYRKTERIGRLTGECEAADETVADMRRTINTVDEAVQGVNRSRVIYTFFGFTAGKNTFIHEVITTAGGRNMAAERGISGFKQLNPEVVVDTNPEWIVLNSDDPDVPKTEAYNSTYAVKNDQIIVLNADYISQPAPRIVQPIKELAQTMYPEAYDDAKFGSGGGPSFAISNATLNRSQLIPGETVRITATVTNNGSEEGTFTAELYVNDSLKTYVDERLDPGETTTITFTRTFHLNGTYAVRFNDELAGTLQVSKTIVTPTPTPTTTATTTATPGQTETEATETTASPTETETSQPTDQAAAATATAEGTDTATPSTTATPMGTTDAEQPGFGFIVGLLAVLIVGGYRRYTTR